MISIYLVGRIGTSLRSQVGFDTIARISNERAANAALGLFLTGIIRYGIPYIPGTASGNDISLAKDDEFIIVDASGIVGMNADRDKQRDSFAELGRDADGNIVGSDERP